MSNKDLVTVIYYTSNREDEAFEAKIRQELLNVIDGLPLISVSHKPLPDFGKNICVGVHTPNDHNLYRQIQLACQEAKTPFVLAAEADCIYPPEYFEYLPEDPNSFYRYANIWILYKKFEYFFQKTSSECGMMAGREYFIKIIEKMLEGRDTWDETPKLKLPTIPMLHKWQTFGQDGNAIISFKTNKGMRQFTRTISGESDIDTLPYWGSVAKLKEEFLKI